MKGHPQGNGGGEASGGVSMMKKKMVMVAVVILVGIMGVMVVQKVKDRRFFSLVIKDKDRQIVSLNLLLQKERQYAKENKRKNQELNGKLYSLRTQKVELNNKIMEMRSAIGSMRDEQRALELAIDEKQKEIKRKESEIEDLKNSLKTVSSIDQSNSAANLTDLATTIKVKERGSWFGRSSNGQQLDNQDIINPDVKVQTLADDNAKIEMHNTTKDTRDAEENGVGFAMRGRRFFIGATANQRDKSSGQNETGQLKANPQEAQTEVTRSNSNTTKGEAKRVEENDAETEADRNTSSNGSEDQVLKEETED